MKDGTVYVVQTICGPYWGLVEGVYTRKRLALAKKESLQRGGKDAAIHEYTINPSEEE